LGTQGFPEFSVGLGSLRRRGGKVTVHGTLAKDSALPKKSSTYRLTRSGASAVGAFCWSEGIGHTQHRKGQFENVFWVCPRVVAVNSGGKDE